MIFMHFYMSSFPFLDVNIRLESRRACLFSWAKVDG